MALRKALHCAVDGEDDEGSKHHFPLGLHNENNREHAASGVNSSSLFIRWSAQLRQPFLCAPSSDNGTRLPHHSPNQTERGGHRSISYLSAYGAIARLEQQGWIEPLPPEERRRPYRITAQGLRVLRAKLTTLRQFAKAGLGRLPAL